MALKPYRATSHWKKIRLQVLNRDGWTCTYCGVSDANEVDHVWPKSRGGEDTLDNLVCACRRCNILKKDKTDSVFSGSTSTYPQKVQINPNQWTKRTDNNPS
jgi:5-methylcytosine-specific restriction endonuclease McrA